MNFRIRVDLFSSVAKNKNPPLLRRVRDQLTIPCWRQVMFSLAVTESIPYLLRINDRVRAGELFHGETGVQVDADLLIGLVGKLTAVERLTRFGVEKVQVVRLAHLSETIFREPRAH